MRNDEHYIETCTRAGSAMKSYLIRLILISGYILFMLKASSGRSSEPKDSLEQALTDLLIADCLAKHAVRYSKMYVPSTPTYMLCTKWTSDSTFRIEQFSIFKDQVGGYVEVGSMRTIKSSLDPMFNPKDSILSLNIDAPDFISLPYLEIGSSTKAIRTLLKDKVSFALDSPINTGAQFIVMSTKWFHILVTHKDTIITNVRLHRKCE